MTTQVAPAELRFRAMGSDVHVLVNGPGGLLQVARDRVEEQERRWSRFRPDSEISRLNALAGSRVHYAGFAVYLMTTVHGLTAGTDGRSPALLAANAAVAALVAGLTASRVAAAGAPAPARTGRPGGSARQAALRG